MHIQDIQVAGVNVDSMTWGIATDRTRSTTRRSNREREGSNNKDDEYSVWIMWNMKLYQVSMIINIQYYNDIWLHFEIVPICSRSSSTLIRLWIQVITTFCPCFLVHLQALRCWNITSNILKLWLGQLIHLLVILSLGRSAATTLGPWWSTLEVSSRSGFGGFDGVLLVNTHTHW
jgi:hypothetical protein